MILLIEQAIKLTLVTCKPNLKTKKKMLFDLKIKNTV
jgi:hypothetical protein